MRALKVTTMPSLALPFQILIAEDNPADIGLVREALQTHGIDCTLHIATDGAAAIEFINRLDRNTKSPMLDLVLADMHLPKRGGEEILKTLRSSERFGLVPVVIMTGAVSQITEEYALKFAALHVFQKPSTLDAFLGLGAVIGRILQAQMDRSR